MAEKRKIRWGVLGFARIANMSVIPAIQRARNSEFYAIASRDEAKLEDCCARHKCPKAYLSYEELLLDPQVDVVYIPLPNSLHREWTIKAAEHGKHVLCEKPIALNAPECHEMVAACKKHRVKLMEAFMYRYTARTRQALEVLRSGVLGDIKYIGSSFRFLLTNPASIKLLRELGGGSLYDVGCYPVNFIGMVVDAISASPPGAIGPESVRAECVQVNGVDMIFSGILRYQSGIIASANCGFNAHRRVLSEIVGTKGLLEVPDTFFDNAGTMTLTTDAGQREIPVEQSDRYCLEVEDFAEAILADREPFFSLAETQRNTEVIDRLLVAGVEALR